MNYNLSIDLHLSKPLFSLDPDNLQLHCFLGWEHCSVVRSFVVSSNHERDVANGVGRPQSKRDNTYRKVACIDIIGSLLSWTRKQLDSGAVSCEENVAKPLLLIKTGWRQISLLFTKRGLGFVNGDTVKQMQVVTAGLEPGTTGL